MKTQKYIISCKMLFMHRIWVNIKSKKKCKINEKYRYATLNIKKIFKSFRLVVLETRCVDCTK
ncbi:unnamed protein product [Moneuplotes crassus]|uniref:Uncharacterized protein n=1 Tax=Euplotes crassus TaxID=5936 RepID=A0AAD2D3Q6_EUPCR|nr:unnamed protein product [Moneuplotes crassus]